MDAVIVVPTLRESCLQKFLQEWNFEFAGHRVIVVEDNPQRTFDVSGASVIHYSWAEIDADLGERSWIIPRRTSGCRSYGLYKAYQLGPDMIVSLDDDCYPCDVPFLERHYSKLTGRVVTDAWVPVGSGLKTRGTPFRNTSRAGKCVLNHGLWANVPDLDAVTQLSSSQTDVKFEPRELAIPRGMYFPMCGMNISFLPELAPALYHLLMGQSYPYDRFDDTWAGIFAKRICDHLNLYMSSGEPQVEHRRASDVWANLRKEAAGLEVNEYLWRLVDEIILTATDVASCYMEISAKLNISGEYWDRLKIAMCIWAELFVS